ncbi:hypothetical protein LCGC14_2204200 [marine sediment metagenome]|uniref:Uncharacterized protein n=1 Tax=marine sediment metagenome TaxID=412755 RepID=A0A0F9DFP9_9ZZZZ
MMPETLMWLGFALLMGTALSTFIILLGLALHAGGMGAIRYDNEDRDES